MKILITGATGLIGKYLVNSFSTRGDELYVVSRNSDSACKMFTGIKNFAEWDNLNILKDVKIDVVINLAGMNLDERRWNKKVKKQIYDSRIGTTRKIAEFISSMSQKPELLISASGVDYYGDTGDEEIYEDSPPADLFISKLVCDWEQEAMKAGASAVRVVVLRTGFVLAPDSKAFKKMVLPFKLFTGGYAGSGKQYLSWIHIRDLVRIYQYIIDNNQLTGAVNACSPQPVRMKEFAKLIGKVLHRPWFFHAPRFLMRILFGEVSDVILAGRKALPKKLMNAGFKFNFENANAAVTDCL